MTRGQVSERRSIHSNAERIPLFIWFGALFARDPWRARGTAATSTSGLFTILPVLALVLACTEPRLRNFLPAGATFERTFGQLIEEMGTRRASHYAVVAYSPTQVRAIATGTVEYVRTFDGMGNCLLLRPKKYLTTPNDFTKLVGLPKPGALVLALCNLDEASVQSAVQALYTDRLSAPEAPPATTHFLNHDEGFTRIDVTAHDTDITQSTLLGSGTGGRLYVAAFVERGDGTPRRYVNPMPYLAAALPAATTLDAVGPSLDEIVLETSASGTFSAADRVTHAATAGTISAPVPRHHLRVAVRTTERTSASAPLVVPYQVGYQLSRLTLSGTSVLSRDVRSKGTLLLNGMVEADAAALGTGIYGATTPIASTPETGPYFLFLGWAPSPPSDEEEAPLNALDPVTPRSIDLAATGTDEAPIVPSGEYELEVTVRDPVNAPTPAATSTVRFSLAVGGAAPGDAVLSYSPVSGPVGTHIALASATPGAFASDTTVEFAGTFDPEGLDSGGTDLAPSPNFTITYPSTKVSITDGEHLSFQVGAVLPSGAILGAGSLRYGRGGRIFGNLRVQTPSTGFDHTTPGVSFTVFGSVRFGQVVGGALKESESVGLFHATAAAQVAAAPDFQRLVAEWRVPLPTSGTAPSTVSAQVRTVDTGGNFLDTQSHTLELVGVESGFAVYRSGAAGGRKLLFIDNGAFTGPHGSDLLAVHAVAGGDVRLDGSPPP